MSGSEPGHQQWGPINSHMITPDEVRRVPLFSELGEAELERLAKRSADIHLLPGEYGAHEAEGRALIAVLEGEAKVTKSIDGIERAVGRRVAGEIFGEVQVVLGTSFLANLQAVTATRLMRIEPREFHAVAAFPRPCLRRTLERLHEIELRDCTTLLRSSLRHA